MAHTLLISDLHLCPKRQHVTELFLHFLRDAAPRAEALYILGDLFEYWAGDDGINEPFHRLVTGAMRDLAAGGVPLFIMHGNRDFLMAEELAAACSATQLHDPTLLNLHGIPALLTHGDLLCTGDAAYQDFRRQVRDAGWIQRFLAQPLAQRKEQIEQLRVHSESEKQYKEQDIMDVSADAVAALLRKHGYPRLIHGHTHRPGRHEHIVDGRVCERWVLGDWGETGNALRCDAHGCMLSEIRI